MTVIVITCSLLVLVVDVVIDVVVDVVIAVCLQSCPFTSTFCRDAFNLSTLCHKLKCHRVR